MSDLYKFDRLVDRHYNSSPLEKNPTELSEFIKNARKVQAREVYKKKVNSIESKIINLHIPTFVTKTFFSAFCSQADQLVTNNLVLGSHGTIYFDNDLILNEINYLNSMHLRIDPKTLIEESLLHIKNTHSDYAEMEWWNIQQNDTMFSVHIIFNEVILSAFQIIG